MKTLNKTLCLVLALVMVLGLFGVASAASFKDDADVQYKEAVDVMTGIGAINGYEDNTFKPAGNVTRAEAAKLVAYAVLGADVAKTLPVGTSSFTDVDANTQSWAGGAIEYFVSKGVINGKGEGIFDPKGNVTSYEIAKMMLCAAGFGKQGEYTGSSWQLNVAIDAAKYKIFEGTKETKFDDAATREEAALYAFNGIQVGTVVWSKDTESYASVVDASEKAVTIASAVYPTLIKGDAVENGVTGYKWYFKGATDPISGFVSGDKVLGTITDITTTGGALYSAYSFEALTAAYVNNEKETAEQLAAYQTAIDTHVKMGDTTKLFAEYAGAEISLIDSNKNGKVDKLAIVYPYLAKVTAVKAATTTDKANYTLTIYGCNGDDNATGIKVYGEGFAKDDYVVVVPMTNSTIANNTTIKLARIEKCTPTNSAITSHNPTKHTVTIGDKTYMAAAEYTATVGVAFDAITSTTATYDFYIYNGFVFAAKVSTAAAQSLEYAFVKGADVVATSSSISGVSITTAKAQIVKMDGSVAVVDLDVKTATKAISNVDDSIAVTGTINVGTPYVVIKTATGTADKYFAIEAGTNATITDALIGELFSFATADGKTTFSEVLATTGDPVVTATLLANEETAVFEKGQPAVEVASATKYATSATKLVLVAADGTATTITGYANFKDATYTVETGVTHIVTVVNDKGIIDTVLVIGAEDDTSEADAYGLFVGAGEVTADGQTYTFIVGTAKKSYLLADGATAPEMTSLGNKKLPTPYAISLDSKGAIKSVDAAAGVGAATVIGQQKTATVGDGYVVINDEIYYTDKTVIALNISDLANENVTPDKLETGDTAMICFSTDANGLMHVEAVFILAKNA